MRIRQVKPAFWADARLAEVPETTRLFYIGLWMIADDVGWFRWNAIEVARDLYAYEPRAEREGRVAAMFAQLVEIERLVVHECGHVEIPTFTTHQRLSGLTKQVQTVYKEHKSRCIPADPRDSPQVPADPRHGIGTGKEQEKGRNGKGTGTGNGSARALAHDGTPALIDDPNVPEFLRAVQ